MKRLLETDPGRRGLRAGATVGRGVNATLALIFLVLFIVSLVVVTSLATLHNRLSDHPDHFNTSRVCILFSSQKEGQFKFGDSSACEAEIYGFAVMAGISFCFLLVSIARVVLAADIWWTAVVELSMLVVLTVLSFSLGLVITSGLSQTCDTVHDINKEENHCDRNVPNDRGGVRYYNSANSAQASVWMAFFLLLLLALVYSVRVFIFFHRLKTLRKSPDRQPVLKSKLEESQTNPI